METLVNNQNFPQAQASNDIINHYSTYLKIFLLTHALWWLTYLSIHFFVPIKHKQQKTTNDSKTRIVSIIHASLIFCLSVYDLLFFQADKCGQQNSFYQNCFLTISFSYFLYDMICCILLDCSDKEMVLHHSFVMIGYFGSIYWNNSANEIIRGLIVAEITNPIMHIRMILRNYHLKHTRLHLTLELTYIILYLISRIGYGTQVLIFTVFCWDNLWFVKFAGSTTWVQSAIFSYRMVGILRLRLKERTQRRAARVHMHWFSVNKKLEDLDYYKKTMNQGYIP